jgi:hypothetical protein
MSKYYCKNCGCILVEGKRKKEPCYDMKCPLCFYDDSHNDPFMEPIPNYETPAHYKERTGKEFPDDGAVWVRSQFTDWELYYFSEAGNVSSEERIVVVANPPVPPPHDWNPE